jgi:hypothetical protein
MVVILQRKGRQENAGINALYTKEKKKKNSHTCSAKKASKSSDVIDIAIRVRKVEPKIVTMFSILFEIFKNLIKVIIFSLALVHQTRDYFQ